MENTYIIDVKSRTGNVNQSHIVCECGYAHMFVLTDDVAMLAEDHIRTVHHHGEIHGTQYGNSPLVIY